MRSQIFTLVTLRLLPTIFAFSPSMPPTKWTELPTEPYPDAKIALPIPMNLLTRDPLPPSTPAIFDPTRRLKRQRSKRVVIGQEDRHLLSPIELTTYPTTVIGRLISTRPGPNGTAKVTLCTGTLIGPRHVTTAAHCMHPEFTDTKIRFEPAFDQELKEGSTISSSSVVRYYREDVSKFAKDPGCGRYDDIAILILEDQLGDQLGYLNVAKVDNAKEVVEDIRFSQQGYPGDFYNGDRPMRQDGIKVIKTATCVGDGPLWTDADASGGMSGGPLWRVVKDDEGEAVWWQYGVLSTGFQVKGEWVASFAAGEAFVNMAYRAFREFP